MFFLSRRRFSIISLFFLAFFILTLVPGASRAENSCNCKDGKFMGCYDINRDTPINAPSDCADFEAKNKGGDDVWPKNVSDCVFNPFSCKETSCGEYICTKSEDACAIDDQCKAKVQGIGNAVCKDGYCYYNALAQNSRGATSNMSNIQLKKPTLRINIPGTDFTDIASTLDDEGYIYLPWIGEYIVAIYKYSMVIGSIIAAVMIVMQGFQIVTSAGGESKSEAYSRIMSIVIGLVLLWASYFVLYTINPDLVTFKSLKIKYIEREELKVDKHECDDPAECPKPEKPAPKKGTCASDLTLAQKNRTASIDTSLFGKVDFRTYGSKRTLDSIKRIVIHNGGYTAKGNNDLWQDRPAAAHYTIQRDGTIYQHAGEECILPHAPGANRDGIGIELNIAQSGGKSCNQLTSAATPEQVLEACSPTAAQYSSLVSLISDITARTSVKINNEQIIGHCEAVEKNGHGDPRAFDWTKIGLRNDIKKQMGADHACSWYLPFTSKPNS